MPFQTLFFYIVKIYSILYWIYVASRFTLFIFINRICLVLIFPGLYEQIEEIQQKRSNGVKQL